MYLIWHRQDLTPEVRWTLRRHRPRRLVGAASAARQLAVRSLNLDRQPARRAARGRLLDSRPERAERQLDGDGDARGQRPRVHAAAPADRSGRVDGAPHARHGGDRRRGLRVRSGQPAAARQQGRRSSWSASRATSWSGSRPRRSGSTSSSPASRAGWSIARSAAGAAATKSGARVFYRDGRPHHLVVARRPEPGAARSRNRRPGSASSACCRTRSTTR